MKKSITRKLALVMAVVMMLTMAFAMSVSAASNAIHAQYNTGSEWVQVGPVAVRAAYRSNSTATLDGYVYCTRVAGGTSKRSFGTHSWSLTGDRTSSRYSTLSKFKTNFGVNPSSSIRKNAPTIGSTVQAQRYTTGAVVSNMPYKTQSNTWSFFHNSNEVSTSYNLSIFSTLHNYYSASNDFFMYPVVVNY